MSESSEVVRRSARTHARTEPSAVVLVVEKRLGGLFPRGREKLGLVVQVIVCHRRRCRCRRAHYGLVRENIVDLAQEWKFTLIARVTRTIVVVDTL